MSGEDFVSALRARAVGFGSKISPLQAREFEKFYGLLTKWNRRINLTALELGVTPPIETLDRLFIEPVIAAELVPAGPLARCGASSTPRPAAVRPDSMSPPRARAIQAAAVPFPAGLPSLDP